jgi:hypothetical protein
MSEAAEVIKPLALAILLAFILTPLVECFENRGLPQASSVVLTSRRIRSAFSGNHQANARRIHDQWQSGRIDPAHAQLASGALRRKVDNHFGVRITDAYSAYHAALSIAAARNMILQRAAPEVLSAVSPPLEPAQELHEEAASSNPVVARANR